MEGPRDTARNRDGSIDRGLRAKRAVSHRIRPTYRPNPSDQAVVINRPAPTPHHAEPPRRQTVNGERTDDRTVDTGLRLEPVTTSSRAHETQRRPCPFAQYPDIAPPEFGQREKRLSSAWPGQFEADHRARMNRRPGLLLSPAAGTRGPRWALTFRRGRERRPRAGWKCETA